MDKDEVFCICKNKEKTIKITIKTSFIPSELHHEKTAICIWENKGADQLHGTCTADQRFVFAT